MSHFKTEAEFQKWLAKTPTARARLQLATSDGAAVPPATQQQVPAPATAQFAAPPRRWTFDGQALKGRLMRAAVWFFVALTGLSALGLWTCVAVGVGYKMAIDALM